MDPPSMSRVKTTSGIRVFGWFSDMARND